MTRCAGCGCECRCEYCDRCAPPPAWLRRDEDARTPDKRWNNLPYATVTAIGDAGIPNLSGRMWRCSPSHSTR